LPDGPNSHLDIAELLQMIPNRLNYIALAVLIFGSTTAASAAPPSDSVSPLAAVAEGAGGTNPPATDEFDCLLEPHLEANVSSASAGVVDEVFVDRGDSVEKHQVLARLQSDVEKRAVELARARAELEARKDVRGHELYKEKFISQGERDELETNHVMAELELKQARDNLERRVVRSPLKGIVVERFRSPGEYVDGDKIFKVVQIDPLNVEVVVPVSMLGLVSKGMRAEVRPEIPVGVVYTATVKVIDRVVDAASGTTGVRLELPNPEHEIPAGLKCKVRFLRH
jgi:RND family efflux transporter MFP subunit